MNKFETTIAGIPAIINVLSWEPYSPAVIGVSADDSYPAEGGCGEWEVCDRRGRPAPWLEAKITESELWRLELEIFERMES